MIAQSHNANLPKKPIMKNDVNDEEKVFFTLGDQEISFIYCTIEFQN